MCISTPVPGCVYKESIHKGGGNLQGVPQRAASSTLIFPQPNFGSRFFLGWVGLRAKTHTHTPYKQSQSVTLLCSGRVERGESWRRHLRPFRRGDCPGKEVDCLSSLVQMPQHHPSLFRRGRVAEGHRGTRSTGRASFEQGGGRGGGGFGPKTWCTKNGLTRFSLL